jgi:prepilin-type N-terminal cleavage/methylation domain-containing protein
MRHGHSLAEVLVVLVIVAVMLGVVVPRASAVLDRVAVEAAAGDVATTLATARNLAIAARASVAIDLDSLSGVLRVRRGAEVLFSRNVGHAHGVRLRTTRDSIAFGARGLGRGAANVSILVARGVVVETVFVSRLGRVR